MKTTTASLIANLMILACLTVGAASAADPVCGTWQWFDNHIRTFRPDGVVVNPAGQPEGTWRNEMARGGERLYVITFGGGKWVDRLALKNGGNLLDGMNNVRFHVTARRVAGASPSAAPVPASGVKHGGMELSAKWIPDKLETRRELLLSLEFYSKAVVGNAPRGKEPVPSTLVGPFRWLMPYDEAVRALPERATRLSERPFNLTCFPDHSLTLAGFQFKSFTDRGQTFNLLYFILDLKRQVVGVQFVEQTPGLVLWSSGPDGVREPYYNFITLTNNGSNTQEVPYEILDGGSGVRLIKTALKKKGIEFYKENVHWYLAAPFARCLLDIVDRNRQAGAIR